MQEAEIKFNEGLNKIVKCNHISLDFYHPFGINNLEKSFMIWYNFQVINNSLLGDNGLEYYCFIAIGLMFGSIFSILFFQMDSAWKRAASFSIGSGSFIGLFFLICNLLNINNEIRASILTYYILVILGSFLVGDCFLFSKLKAQDTSFKLKSLDILLGYKRAIEMYYENRQKEINNLLGFDEIEHLNQQLKDREALLNKKEKDIKDTQEIVEKSIRQIPHFILPVNKSIPVDNTFLNVLPSYIEDLTSFSSRLALLTNDFIKKYPKRNNKKEIDFIKAYFLGISMYVTTLLFDSRNIRVHFRYLDENENYVKLIASNGEKSTDDPLTPIPSSHGMIHEAGKIKRSLIKSLNEGFHIQGSHDDVWVDYLTMTIDGIYKNGKPFITMGISVNNSERYKNQLYFFNFSRIEKIIQQNITYLNKECNVFDKITNLEVI